jgi:uncharacterized membrane protein
LGLPKYWLCESNVVFVVVVVLYVLMRDKILDKSLYKEDFVKFLLN